MSTKSRLTLEEYDRMIERGEFDHMKGVRIELIYGELREMVPPGPTHEEIVDLLNKWSYRNVDDKIVRVRIQNSIGLPDSDSAPQPDVAWVPEKSYREGRPSAEDALLVIEVADSSLVDDRREKAIVYADAGIQDYWIVNVRDWCVEVHRDPQDGAYQSISRHDVHDTISPLAFPDVKLDVRELFQS